MKKILLISLMSGSALFADTMTDMAKDAALSEVKTTAKAEAVKQVSGNTAASVMDSGSMKEKAVDMAVDKVAGSNEMAKKVVKEASKVVDNK